MWTRYDQMNGRELKAELSRRFGTNSGCKKLPLNRNEAGYKYRLFFIQDDLKNGINPYLPAKIEPVTAPPEGIASQYVSE
jgi:hypothetical protein